jgi:hypothetical protein
VTVPFYPEPRSPGEAILQQREILHKRIKELEETLIEYRCTLRNIATDSFQDPTGCQSPAEYVRWAHPHLFIPKQP